MADTTTQTPQDVQVDQLQNSHEDSTVQQVKKEVNVAQPDQQDDTSSQTQSQDEQKTTKDVKVTTHEIKSLTDTINEQLARSAKLLGGSSAHHTVEISSVKVSTTGATAVNTGSLTALNHKVDQILGRTSHVHTHTITQSATLPQTVDAVLRKSAVLRSSYVSAHREISPVRTSVTVAHRFSPVRTSTIQTYAHVVPQTYAQTSYSAYTSPVKYVIRAPAATTQYVQQQVSAPVSAGVKYVVNSNYAQTYSATLPAQSYSATLPVAARQSVYSTATYAREAPRVSVAPVKKVHHREEYHCGVAENDVDSMVLDTIERQNQDRKEKQEDYKNYFAGSIVDDQLDQQAETKLNKRQEILNARRSQKGTQQVAEDELAAHAEIYGQTSQASQQNTRVAAQNAELVTKGPYEQKAKEQITPAKAQQYFESNEDAIEDFNFAK